MSCLKCGRNTQPHEVFCNSCLQEMEKYPVRPDIEVKLPERKAAAAQKKQSKKRTVAAEEQIRVLKKRCRILFLLLIFFILLATALAFPAVEHLMEDNFKIGQNYSTVTGTEGS